MIAFGMWLMVPLLEAVDPSLGGPRWLVVIEETLETVGETLMLAALVGYMRLRDWYGAGSAAATRRVGSAVVDSWQGPLYLLEAVHVGVQLLAELANLGIVPSPRNGGPQCP